MLRDASIGMGVRLRGGGWTRGGPNRQVEGGRCSVGWVGGGLAGATDEGQLFKIRNHSSHEIAFSKRRRVRLKALRELPIHLMPSGLQLFISFLGRS